MNRLTIRIRITIGTLILAGIFFAGAAFAIDLAMRGILQSTAITVLASDAAPYKAAIKKMPVSSIDSAAEGQLVAVIDPEGVARVSNLSPALTAALPPPHDQAATHTVATARAEYLVRVEKVATPQGIWLIYTARNDASSDLVRDSLRQGLIVGLGILTVLFGASSWLLTGAALRPVGQLRRDAEALANSDGRGSLPVGDARDEVHDLAITLNSLIDRLHNAAERERQMVSDASHELRTPLAVLQSQLELVRTGDRATLDADIAAAQRAVSRLSRLSSTLLELSRIEADADSGTSTFTQLAEELADAVDRARFAARASATTIDYTIDEQHDGVPAGYTAHLSPHDFSRIVDNLADNAVRAVHTTGTEGWIDVRLSIESTGVVLVVSDSGPGMPDDFVPRAFDRFTRANKARETDGGSGLGLSIVSALVHRAGGSIALENAAGSGLVARVTLPFRQR